MALPLFLLTMLIFSSTALVAASKAAENEPLKDYIFRGMPNFKLESQVRNFEELTILSAKPESEETAETTYEGNRVFSSYNYVGKEETVPSPLQIVRNYQEAVKKLGGETLYYNKEDKNKFHGSFTRNDKQYYIAVNVYNSGWLYEVFILELAEMQKDIEIIDADTILHKLEKEGHIALYINFDTGKATLKPDAAEVIAEIVTALKSKPQLKVKLEGHTDNVGNAAANKKLSDDRAKAVMAAIVGKGIDKGRLSAEGFGLEKPIADNNTDEGRGKNRRVELVKQ